MNSHILKVKDENGNWISIPAIKGAKGDGVPDGGEEGQIIVKTADGTEWQDNIDAYTKQETDDLLDTKVPTSRTINGQDLSQDITIDTLPSQTGQSGKFLTTNGTNPSWQEIQTDGANTDLSNLSDTGQSKFDAKVDVSSLVEVNPMIDSYISGTDGYNIWANGYCEQWGYVTRSTNPTSVSLTKTFADTNYRIFTQASHASDIDGRPLLIRSDLKEVNSFSVATNTAYSGFYWEAKGYLAEGEY